MKKMISLTLAAILAASVLASCATAPTDELLTPHSSLLTSSSSDYADGAWLEERLGGIPDNVTVGTADSLGIDMSGFEDDGYIIRTTDGETVVCGKTSDGLDRAVRKYAKEYEAGSIVDVTYHEGYRVKSLTVAGNPVADYVIVVPADADECLTFASTELRDFIENACGAVLPITTAAPADGRCFMLVTTEKTGDLGEDGFEITVTSPTVTIRGGEVRGCMYGVYDFLEDQLGYRFLTYSDTILCDAEHIDIPDGFKNKEVPQFATRNVRDSSGKVYTKVLSSTAYGDYVVRRKGTASSMNQAKYGWQPTEKASHNLAKLCGTDREKQPCLNDEDIFDFALESLMKTLDTANAAGEIGTRVKQVNLGQEDNPRFCECKACRAKLNKYGSQAGVMLDFANRMAEALWPHYPTVYVSIYAYWGAITPPKKIEAHPMVSVCYVLYGFCPHHSADAAKCDSGHCFQENLNNFVHVKNLEEWNAITKNLILYPYGVDFWECLSPYMNYDDYCANYSFYASFDIMGVSCENGMSQLSFDQLSIYLMYELSWDPTMSEDTYYAKMRDFMACFYGDGWESLYTYLINVCRAKDKLPCGEDDPFDWFAENYGTLCDLFDTALKYCDSAEQEERIERLSLHMHWGALCGMYESRYINGSAEDRAWMQSIADYIRDTMLENGVAVWGLANSNDVAKTNFNLAEADPKGWSEQKS